MSYTPERIAKIRKKESETPDALKRDPNVNYYEGWFFVTLNTRDNVPVLSWCVEDACASKNDVSTIGKDVHASGVKVISAHCKYSDVGKGVLAAWKRNEEIYPNVKVDLAEAMPEHFHGLIHLLPGNKKHLGHIIAGFMSGCSHAYWDSLGIDWRKDRYWENTCVAKWADKDKDHTMSFRGPALFVHGFNDMVPITNEEVEVKRAYIRDQALKRVIQGDNHECFKKHRHQHSKNWTVERCVSAVVVDRCFRYDMTKRERAINNVLTRLNRDACASEMTSVVTLPSGAKVGMPGIGLDYVGDKALLYNKKKLPLVCHSADIRQFEQQKEAVLKATREGAIIVSAFISQKERDIKTQLMVEQLPFIEIMDNGFSDKYKGVGKAFYALAENRLVQITPWKYLYQKGGAQVSREMCLVMNELARVISGVPDNWWKISSGQHNNIIN